MSVAQIQSFLNSKAPSCYGSMCLKNYRENNRSAAQIMYDIGQTHRINPQVFIVTLQKEVGLVTSTNPQNWMYRTAMGFGCPDSTPGVCDSRYFGFTNQINQAGRFFRAHLDNAPGWFKPHMPGWNSILYHPRSSCGTQRVFIENRATAALYSYTPYVPNQAALNAGYGTGNSCSSYGNRNFHLFFNSWFGSPIDALIASGHLWTPSSTATNQPAEVSFWVRNTSKSNLNLGRLKVVARSTSGANFDYESVDNVTLAPGQTFNYRKSRLLTEEGVYTLSIGRYADGRWHIPPFEAFGSTANPIVNATAIRPPTLTQGLGLSNVQYANKDIDATFTIKNNSVYTSPIGRMVVAVRDENNNNRDFAATDPISLQSGQQYVYRAKTAMPESGSYRFWIANHRENVGWSDSYPESASPSLKRSDTRALAESVQLTAPIEVPQIARSGDPLGATFTITNFGDRSVDIGRIKIAARDSKNKNHDLIPSPYMTLGPGESYTYLDNLTKLPIGDYRIWLASHRINHGWSDSYPVSATETMKRTGTVTIKPSVTLTSSVLVPANAARNADVAARFTIKNHSTNSVNLGRVKLAVRNERDDNYDFSSSPDLVLQPGQEYSYSLTKRFKVAGRYSYWLANYHPERGWSDAYPPSETPGTTRNGTITIQ